MSLATIAAPARAAALLKPMRMQILDALREPGSASTVARQLGIARQKINYHLRELEKAGFIEEVEERRTGNCIERIVRAKATHYLIDPEVLGSLAADPDAIQDHFSSTYLVALAAQAIRDLGALREKADAAKKRIATFSLQSDVRFANAADRHAFAEELANAVARLVAKYHDDEAEGGRNFRLFLGAYPARRKEQP
ncbi:MAG TPA: helix-turn-helix domain-containing protein [Thermoanaerobaculia bacterium]|nr:helix-turn-helix domain-containing protein [Thermoanaerobaculia bacterium]